MDKTPQTGQDSSFSQRLTIGEAADLLGIAVPTLRMYERAGLLIPARRESGHRRYTQKDIERIRCMRERIKSQHVSIEGIKRLLSLIPCWRIKNCPESARTSCGAFVQSTEPCWMVSGKSWECRSAECRTCPVYTDFATCDSLKSTIAKYTLQGTAAPRS